jgi:hypothetical protein
LQGASRWTNYYIEGLYWSVSQEPFLDGIYYDGINFDRRSMQRIRKALVSARDSRKEAGGAINIDVHTGHDDLRLPSIAYLSHFPCELSNCGVKKTVAGVGRECHIRLAAVSTHRR